VASENEQSVSFTRKLGVNQRVLLALACVLWICANLFPQRSDLGLCIVSLVQLIAAILIFVRLRHSTGYFRTRSLALLVVVLVTGVDLFISLWQLSGHEFPLWVANLGPIELAAALAAVIYCIFTRPTRLMLLLYTVTFVAGIHAVALTLVFWGNRSSAAASADFLPFLTAKSLSIFGLIVSLIYPIYFVAKGRYARQYKAVGG
jgi:hypothetical protein